MSQDDGSHDDDAVPAGLGLESVEVRGFRSLEDVGSIRLSSQMTVLTGQNDGGKTALLDALGFLLDRYAPDAQDPTAGGSGEAEVLGEFVASNGGGDRMVVRARREADGSVSRQVSDRVHGRFGARPGDMSLDLLKEAMREAGVDLPGGTRKQPYVDAAETWIAGRPNSELGTVWRDLTADERARLPELETFESATAADPTAHVSSFASKEVHRILRESPYEQLEDVRTDLQARVDQRMAQVRQKILDHCPEFSDVTVTAEADFTRPTVRAGLFVHRTGEQISLVKEGEGIRRRVTLALHEGELTALEDAPAGATTIVAYDEPDTHLDYAAQRALFDILDQQSRLAGVQVVVATHSRNFIDRAPLSGIVHVRLDDRRRTQIETLADPSHAEEMRFLGSVGAGLGLRNSMLLDERCFLVVEGETEHAAVPELYRLATGRSINATGITILNTQGSRAVRRLVEVVAGDWNRAAVVLVDTDARGELTDSGWLDRLGLTEGSDVFFVGDNEFEDAFDDQQWADALNQEFPVDDGPWTQSDVADFRSAAKFSTELVNGVRRRVRDHTIGKPDLGLALAQALSSAHEIPPSLRAALDAAHEIATRSPISPPK